MIAMRQAEFPTDLKPREAQLPVGSEKIVTIPGVRRCGKSYTWRYKVKRT